MTTSARWFAAVLAIAAAFAPRIAAAQLTAGPISQLVASANPSTSPVKGSDVAWDPVNRVFLAVVTCYNSCPYGQVYGIFTNPNGVAVGNPFSIKMGGAGHFPRARYSAHVNGGSGGFLVVWHEEATGGNALRTRVVVYSNGIGVTVGSENTINGNAYGWLESAAAVAYSPTSQRFLVAWRVYPSVPGVQVTARLVDINGAAVGGLIKLSSGFGRDPGVAWNSTRDEFGVSFGNENSSGSAGFMSFAVVNPSTGSFIRNSLPAIAGFTFVTDIDYNPNTQRYIMTWHQQPAGRPQVWMAELAADGSVVTQGLVTTSWPAYDALAVAFNPLSGTLLLTSLRDPNDNIDGVELNARGYRYGDIVNLGPGVSGKYVRNASASDDSRWLVGFSDAFRSLKAFAVRTTSANGGPPGCYGTNCVIPIGGCLALPPNPIDGFTWKCVDGLWVLLAAPPPVRTITPPTLICADAQPATGWTCVNGQWVPPVSTCTTVQPGPDWTCVNGDWRPPTAPQSPASPTRTTAPVSVAPGSVRPLAPPHACPSTKPGRDWVCVSGNWLPPGVKKSR